MDTITVYIPKTSASNMVMTSEGVMAKPDEFWTSKPEGWANSDLAVVNVALSTYTKWINSKQLIKG